MADYKKGDRVRCIKSSENGDHRVEVGWEGVVFSEEVKNDVSPWVHFDKYPNGEKTSISEKRLELITPFKRKNKECNHYESSLLTTEYLEPVGEESPNLPIATAEIEEGQESFDLPQGYAGGTVRFEMKSTLDNIRTWKENHYIDEPIKQPITKTIMQKLTSALKRALSSDKQTLYKAGIINGGLDLSCDGQNAYVNAMFQNDGDHKKAMAEMVADAKEVLEEDAK